MNISTAAKEYRLQQSAGKENSFMNKALAEPYMFDDEVKAGWDYFLVEIFWLGKRLLTVEGYSTPTLA